MDKEDFKDALANLVFEYFKHNDKDIHECYAICFVNGERYNLNSFICDTTIKNGSILVLC